MSNHKTQRSEDLTLGPVTLSYPQLFTPEPIVNGEPKFSCNIIMAPEIAAQLNQASQQLAAQAFPGGEYQQPAFQWPFAQVESKTRQPHYAQKFPGHFIASPKSGQKFPPQIVGHDRQPLVDRGKVFPGALAYVVVNLYSYSEGINTGIGIGLSAVMVWGEGERLTEGAAVDVNKAFGGIQVTPVAGAPGPAGMAPAQGQPGPMGMPQGARAQQPVTQAPPMTGPMEQANFGQPGTPLAYQQPAQPAPQATPQQAVDPATGKPFPMPSFG